MGRGRARTPLRADTVCQLAWRAFHLRRKLHWDPEREWFVNDPDANRELTRSSRAPWRLQAPACPSHAGASAAISVSLDHSAIR